MKKLRYLTLFLLVFLTGCEKRSTLPAPLELFTVTGDTTSSGVSVGDGPGVFKDAYQNYEILVSRSLSEIPHEVMSIGRIPYTDNISTMIANFFINGTPMTEDQICEDENVSMDGLTALLCSSSYLREHEVIYRYLLFSWENGVISKIESEELDYNETFEVPARTQ